MYAGEKEKVRFVGQPRCHREGLKLGKSGDDTIAFKISSSLWKVLFCSVQFISFDVSICKKLLRIDE